jgi:hypothetical protein
MASDAEGKLQEMCYFGPSPITKTQIDGFVEKGYFHKGLCRSSGVGEEFPEPEED